MLTYEFCVICWILNDFLPILKNVGRLNLLLFMDAVKLQGFCGEIDKTTERHQT